MNKIDLNEFIKRVGVSKVTILQWIKDGRVEYEKKRTGFNKFKYLFPESEVDRIKALRG